MFAWCFVAPTHARTYGAGGALTLAFVDRPSDGHQPTLVGGGDSDDGFDRAAVAGDRHLKGATPREGLVEMTSRARPPSAPRMAAGNGRTGAASNGHGTTAASRNGRAVTTNGGVPYPGGGELSPGPSPGLSPLKSKRGGKGAGMGMYARVGGGGADEQPRREFGMFGEDSSEVYHGRGGGVPGNREDDERQTLALGRTGEVEGQLEVVGGGSRWEGDSDSGSSDVGGRSGLVEPA